METQLIKQIAVTFEMCGSTLSEAAQEIVIRRLEAYPPAAVSKALTRCIDEVKGRLYLASIIERIDDGRPGPNEAWAMLPKTEHETAVWTEEMSRAYMYASPLMHDKVAARMAFIEAYKKLLQEARTQKRPIEWKVSMGDDMLSRESVLLQAVNDGRILPERARVLVPGLPPMQGETKALPEHNPATPEQIANARKRLAEITGETTARMDGNGFCDECDDDEERITR